MTDRSFGKGLFLVNLAILSGIVAVLLYQVPQPWRGYLVVWLLLLGSLGVVLLKVLKHVYAYKSLKLTTTKGNSQGARASARRAGRPSLLATPQTSQAPSGLKIVQAEDVGRGRHTIN